MKSSPAASGLCDWIINITMYYDVVVSVEPKKLAVKEAQETLAAANQKKEEVDALVAELNAPETVVVPSTTNPSLMLITVLSSALKVVP